MNNVREERRYGILLVALIWGALASCEGPIGSPGEGRVPDLLVTSPSVSDAGLEPAGRFTLSATVSNAGDGARGGNDGCATSGRRTRRSRDRTPRSAPTRWPRWPLPATAPNRWI